MFNFSAEEQPPYAVAVSPDGTYFATNYTDCVTMIRASATDPKGTKKKRKLELPAGAPANQSTKLKLAGLALDNSNNLLVGFLVGKESYICTYTQDMVRLGSIKIHLEPQYLAVTSTNAIVVSSTPDDPQGGQVQVINHKGTRLHTLTLPDGVTTWWPRGVCCTEGMILVANNASTSNDHNDTGIYCYSISGQYLECITNDEEVYSPMGLAVTDNDRTLMVAESGKDEGVKVFRREDFECPVGKGEDVQITSNAQFNISERAYEASAGVSGYKHSSDNFELNSTASGITVKENVTLTARTASTLKYETVSGVSFRKKSKHQESSIETDTKDSPDYHRDNASSDDDDDDDDTFDLTVCSSSTVKQRTVSAAVSLEVANSSQSYQNSEAETSSQEENSERNADGVAHASHGSDDDPSLRNISDNYDWLF